MCVVIVSALASTPMVSSSAEDGGLAQYFLDNRVHADFVVRFASLGVDHLSAFVKMFTRLRLTRASWRRSRGQLIRTRTW